MKTITVPDLHGHDFWKRINVVNYDKVIFLGDYVDSFKQPNEKIYMNLIDILHLKADHPDRVVLLLGNHDIQYMYYPEHRCSGFRKGMADDLITLFRAHAYLFAVAYQHENWLWTHAGISIPWYRQHASVIEMFQQGGTLADALNRLMQTEDPMLHEVGYRRGGSADVGGITWADRKEIVIHGSLPGYHQVVGHTPIDEITTLWKDGKKGDTSITFCDCLKEIDRLLSEKKPIFLEKEIPLPTARVRM